MPVHLACRFISKFKLGGKDCQKYLVKEKIIKSYDHEGIKQLKAHVDRAVNDVNKLKSVYNFAMSILKFYSQLGDSFVRSNPYYCFYLFASSEFPTTAGDSSDSSDDDTSAAGRRQHDKEMQGSDDDSESSDNSSGVDDYTTTPNGNVKLPPGVEWKQATQKKLALSRSTCFYGLFVGNYEHFFLCEFQLNEKPVTS